ncbi:MAG: TadE/TadG family type IV pilus assembly protein [Planctomycetaceae bacterium]
MKSRTKKLNQPGRRGTVAVEFALVSTIILLLFFGGLEMTCLNLIRHTAGNASYEAARKMIVPGGTAADAGQEAMRLLRSVGATQDVTIDAQDDGTKVTVTISVPVSKNSWGLLRFSGGMTISKSCTLSRQL